MAVYTPMSREDASRLTQAHGLGPSREVTGLAAGSVNSNFIVELESGGRVFARIYEEQEADGVAYEWALLAHLAAAQVSVPRRIDGPPPGALRVAGKPTALFELEGGEELCQARVDVHRTARVGAFLARAHVAGASFPTRRSSRFDDHAVAARLEMIRGAQRPELAVAVRRLDETLRELEASGTLGDARLERGVIHGDLFRDNVRWVGDEVEVALDWESASDGLFVFDLAVTLLAWCYGDVFDWGLAAAMARGYASVRPLSELEWGALRSALLAAAIRFTVTRITDFHLRASAEQKPKDWRRFLARLEAVAGTPDVAERLRG